MERTSAPLIRVLARRANEALRTMYENAAKADIPDRRSIRIADQSRSIGEERVWRTVLDRQQPAVRRYLRDSVADGEAAEHLFQKFARMLHQGDLPGISSPSTAGPCRDLFRSALVGLVCSHLREVRWPTSVPPTIDDQAELARFDAIWRLELLDRAWAGLREHEQRTGQPFHTTLRCRVEAPGLSSPELAEEIGRQLGKTVSAPNARQLLHRARAEFSRLLLDEVRDTLPPGAPFEVVERELIATGLLAFCREAVDRVRPDTSRRRR